MSDFPERELSGIESALRGLVPSAGDFDRDGLFFRAGQHVVRKRRWLWPLFSAGLAGLAGTLAVLLVLQPRPTTIERIVYVQAPREAADAGEDVRPDSPIIADPRPMRGPLPVALPGSYLRMRDQVLRFGVESLPEVTFPAMNQPARPMSVFDSYERALPNI